MCRTPYNHILNCKARNIRNLKLRDFFRQNARDYDPNDFKNKFLAPSEWIPPTEGLSPEVIDAIQLISRNSHSIMKDRFIRCSDFRGTFIACRDNCRLNLTKPELAAIAQLRNNKDVVIKPADKGGAVVIMDREAYKSEGLRQLNNNKYYEEIDGPLADVTSQKINSIIRELLDSGVISQRQFDGLRSEPPHLQRAFYLLPKLHKAREKWPRPDMPEGRPIVSDCGSETYNICNFIDYFLKPLANHHPSYLKDTYDFVSKIRGKGIPPGALLVTGDVTALYTNMDIQRSLDVVREQFIKQPHHNRPDAELLQLLEICLKNNDFRFAGRTFLQTCGTAMGKTFAPSLANLYLLHLDDCAMAGFRIKPLCFYRYLDDIFLVWPGSEEDLREYSTYLNNLIPGIKITLTVRHEFVEFLDTRVYKFYTENMCSLRTRVYFKPTDTHQLLHGSSFHPRHTTRGIMKSQIIRFKRLSSSKCEFDYACRILFDVLRCRGYARSVFRRIKSEVWSSNIDYFVRASTIQKQSLFPIVNYYDRIGSKLMQTFHSSIADLDLFDNTKIVRANCIHPNLARLITRSHLEE